MPNKDWSGDVKEKTKKYSQEQIIFTKTELIDWLCKRNNTTADKLKKEVLNPINLAFAEKQQAKFEGKNEERFRCYFVYSKNKGRCNILRFKNDLKIITVFPIGRTTLKKYRKRFK